MKQMKKYIESSMQKISVGHLPKQAFKDSI